MRQGQRGFNANFANEAKNAKFWCYSPFSRHSGKIFSFGAPRRLLVAHSLQMSLLHYAISVNAFKEFCKFQQFLLNHVKTASQPDLSSTHVIWLSEN